MKYKEVAAHNPENNGCSGCPLYVIISETNVKQCKYFAYKKSIINCPCKECLLKVICTQFCGDFYTIGSNEHNYCAVTKPNTSHRV
jgi:hypothetical protein